MKSNPTIYKENIDNKVTQVEGEIYTNYRWSPWNNPDRKDLIISSYTVTKLLLEQLR